MNGTNISNSYSKDIFARVSDTNEDILKEYEEDDHEFDLEAKVKEKVLFEEGEIETKIGNSFFFVNKNKIKF